MNFVKKSLVLLCSFLAFSFFAPLQVFADNDDSSVPECTIAVNGVIIPNHSQNFGLYSKSPQVSASRITPDRSSAEWDTTITLSPAAQARFQECGGQLSVDRSYNWTTFQINSLTNVYNVRITKTGQEMFDPTDFSYMLDVQIDTADGIPSRCPDGEPICRRAYVSLDQDTLSNSDLSCDAEIAKFKAAVQSKSSEMSLGSDYGFAYDTTNLKTACLLADIQVQYSRVTGNDSNTIYFSNDTNPATFSFRPQYIGDYQIRFTVQKTSGFIKVDLDSVTKTLCVKGPDGECKDQSSEPVEAESLPSFNICHQIPVLTDEQIANRVNQAPESQQTNLTEELQARKQSYRKEKIACCLCATGNEVLDENGQCPAMLREDYEPGLYTAVGCVATTPEGIVKKMVTVGLGIAGGVALLMILSGAFIYTTSQGEPKKIGEAKDMITSAVMGLLFIIFSVAILRFIGISVLQIPGFGQ